MEAETPEPRPLSFLGAALWTLAVGLGWPVLVSIFEAARPGAANDLVTLTTSQVLAHSIVIFAILRVHEPQTSVREVLALKRPPLLSLPLAAIVGASLAGPAGVLNDLLTKRFPIDDKDREALEKVYALDTPSKQALVFAATVVIVPVCEELFFRGVLFTGLRRRARADVVIFATAAYDALLGWNPRVTLTLLALLVIVGWIRARTDSVWPSLVARVGFFGAAVGPEIVGKSGVPTTPAWIGGAIAVSAIGLLAIGGVTRERAISA